MKVKRADARSETTRSDGAVERLLGDRWIVYRHTRAWQPPTDVYENDDGIVVRIEVAGMRSEEFSISLAGRTLVVAGVRADEAPKRTYHQMEIRFGEFRAEVGLPWQVEPQDVDARYEEGFLTVHLPRPRSQHVPVVGAEAEEGR